MTNECRVYFALYGENFDPDEATQIIGIEPTSVRRKKEPRPKHSSWEISTDNIKSDIIDVYEMSSTLISKLSSYAAKIASVKQQFKLEAVLEIVVWIAADDSISTPAIGFKPEVIAFLNTVGAYIDIDTYLNMP